MGLLLAVISCASLYGAEKKGISFPKNYYAVVDGWKDIRLKKFTVAAWIKAGRTNGSRVVANAGETSQLFTFYIFKNRMRMLIEERPCIYKKIHTRVTPKEWEHYTGVFDGKNIKLYKNGKLVKSASIGGMFSDNGTPLYLGAESPGAGYFSGRLEDIAIWDTALSDAEIKKLNSADSPRKVAESNLLALWNSDTFNLKGRVWKNAVSENLNARIQKARPVHPSSKNVSENTKNFMSTAKDTYIGKKYDGYRGVWYAIQPLKNKYTYKYSGGMATYTAKHRPMAVYAPAVNKTFFTYGGSDFNDNRRLIHMVGCYDHATGTATKPTALLDKQTSDAHDNPVISLDDNGYIWIFSTSHGRNRFSYIYKSKKPYNIDEFSLVKASKVDGKTGKNGLMYNFSYLQPWFVPGKGFICFFTYYGPGRQIFFMTSEDGVHWSKWTRLALIKRGNYQVSLANTAKAATAFNYHPDGPVRKGVNYRTNLYYVQTRDFGKTWEAADGTPIALPVNEVKSPALVHDYEKENLLVYMKDLRFDENNNPVILYVTSKGYVSGPENNPRTWHTARWTGKEWVILPAMTSDNNYDMGSLYLEKDGTWRIIAPTQSGPQDYNPGGEMAMWTSEDKGKTWKMVKQLTSNSKFNHSYARRPVTPNDGFYAFWADGHGRESSDSRLYFCDKAGSVYKLPFNMKSATAKPEVYTAK